MMQQDDVKAEILVLLRSVLSWVEVRISVRYCCCAGMTVGLSYMLGFFFTLLLKWEYDSSGLPSLVSKPWRHSPKYLRRNLQFVVHSGELLKDKVTALQTKAKDEVLFFFFITAVFCISLSRCWFPWNPGETDIASLVCHRTAFILKPLNSENRMMILNCDVCGTGSCLCCMHKCTRH